MVHSERFIEALRQNGISFFTGVPDSLLKDLLASIEKTVPQENHIPAANEGSAIGIAAGYHLATSAVPAVYMQNSGLGNAINPLTSLADPEVYSIPLLLIIGWRGQPGVKDEPQHKKQGRITTALLDTLEIPHETLSPDMDATTMASLVAGMAERARAESRPTALVVCASVFEPSPAPTHPTTYPLGREEAIGIILDTLRGNEIVVSTTGKISRELYESRKKRGQGMERDFLTVGSMGHASQIALGIARQKEEREVYCLDGDGATIMHMGGLATIGWMKPKNFKHIVLNNMAHESVGGQPSAASVIDLAAVARANGYRVAETVEDAATLSAALLRMTEDDGPVLLEIKVNIGSRADLGRPKESPSENKKGFMDFLHEAD